MTFASERRGDTDLAALLVAFERDLLPGFTATVDDVVDLARSCTTGSSPRSSPPPG